MPSVLLSNWKILLYESVMSRHSQNHTPVIIENKQMHVTYSTSSLQPHQEKSECGVCECDSGRSLSVVGRAVRVMRRTKHDVTTRRRRVGWDCSGGLKQAGARMGKKTSLHLLCCAV